MKYFLDCEFIENGSTIDLVSIALVREDGREYYAQNTDAEFLRASDWVWRNVFPHLQHFDMRGQRSCMERTYCTGETHTGKCYKDPCPWRNHSQIRDEVKAFIDIEKNGKPEIWGYYCVTPDTRILTSDLRWVPISSVNVGDELLAFDEHLNPGNGRSGKWRQWKKSIAQFKETINRPCFELCFDDGTIIKCTGDHKWLTSNGESAKWVETINLKHGWSKVAKPVDVWSVDESRDSGYLSAAFDGEGHLSQSLGSKSNPRVIATLRACFSQKPNQMLDNVRRILLDKGFTIAKSDRPAKSGVYTIAIGNRSQVLRLLGSIRPERLLPKFDASKVGAMNMNPVMLISKTEIGNMDVISLKTSTGTYIAEGLCSHNCSYDWVAFCQLFGSMIELPKGYPMFCRDIIQECKRLGNPELTKQDSHEHNCLEDARWNKKAWEFLNNPKPIKGNPIPYISPI